MGEKNPLISLNKLVIEIWTLKFLLVRAQKEVKCIIEIS